MKKFYLLLLAFFIFCFIFINNNEITKKINAAINYNSIGNYGYVYVDTNSDGIQNNGEAGYNGATVTITTESIPSGHTNDYCVIKPAVTNSSGSWYLKFNAGDKAPANNPTSWGTSCYQTNWWGMRLSVPSGYQLTKVSIQKTSSNTGITPNPYGPLYYTSNPPPMIYIASNYEFKVNFGIKPIPANTPIPTRTPTPIPTKTPTPIPTKTPTPTPTSIPTSTPIPTKTPTPTMSPTVTPTPTKMYSISGKIFKDADNNHKFASPDSVYSTGNAGVISISSGYSAIVTNGTYTTGTILPAGSYTVAYSTLPTGYYMTYPKPPLFLVTVGLPGCDAGSSPDAACSSGNVTDLNFGIADSFPWIQLIGLNGRMDKGYKTSIPSSPNSSCGAYASIRSLPHLLMPGIISTGGIDPVFGQGNASTTNWVVGGSQYPEIYTGSAKANTSYFVIENKVKALNLVINDLSTLTGCATLSSCTLPGNLPGGVYKANGDLTLNAYTFPDDNDYIFLVNGSVKINGKLLVPDGSDSTFLITASEDLIIDKDIHPVHNSCPAPHDGQLQGVYSADKDVWIQGINNCTISEDLMLNIDGSLVVNAGGGGGSMVNDRNLCSDNSDYPSLTIKARPDFILNSPEIITVSNIISREIPN